MLALAVLAIVPACSGEDDEPVVPQASDPNVAVPDPEGTVTVNITNNIPRYIVGRRLFRLVR